MLTILHHRNFSLLWVAGFISLLGDWVLYTVFPFYIAKSTGSALATGAMAVVEVLPGLLFGSIVGVFVDRWDRKRTMIGADFLRALVLLLLFVVQSPRILWVIYVVAFAETSISLFFGPAKVALMRQVVNDQDLVSANALNSISDNVCRLVGPAIGGGIFLLLGLHSLVVIDSASYILSGLLIGGIVLPILLTKQPDSTQSEATKRPLLAFWQQWLQGFQFIHQRRWLVTLCVFMAIAMVGQGILNALLAIFAEQVVKMNAQVYGWFVSIQGIGGLVGGFTIGKVGKAVQPARLLGSSIGAAGLLLLLLVNVPLIPVALVSIAIIGIFVIGWIVSLQTLLQRGVDKAYLGRVLGTYGATQTLSLLIGASGGAILGNLLGVVPVLTAAGGLLVLAGVGSLIFLDGLEKAGGIVQSTDGPPCWSARPATPCAWRK